MRRAVAATMPVEETQPVAVEAAAAATQLLVASVGGAATVQPPKEAADATAVDGARKSRIRTLTCWRKGTCTGQKGRLTCTPL